jgi:thiamine kinase-like enzyme
MKTNKINEELEMDMTTYKKVKGTIDPKTPVKITGEKPAVTDTSVTTMTEEDSSIESKTPETIKYLSNVKDAVSGKVSQPFTIKDKKYQMIRGIKPSKEIVMGVFCHNDLDESGNNIIHSIEEFEKNIAKPMIQQEVIGNDLEVKEQPTQPIKKEPESLNLAEFKHYLVNEKSGKFRKFKNIVELAYF